jgi:hypothetical protein
MKMDKYNLHIKYILSALGTYADDIRSLMDLYTAYAITSLTIKLLTRTESVPNVREVSAIL